MACSGVSGFSAVWRAVRAPRAAARTNPSSCAGARRHYLLELQWQGAGGRFRHIAINPPGWLPALGAAGSVVLLGLALAAVGAFSAWPSEAVGLPGVNALARENAELLARQDALRERAFDLAEQLYLRVEKGRRMLWMAGTPGRAWENPCPRPPARDAGDEAILAWLSEQATRLEAVESELMERRAEVGARLASAPVPQDWDWATRRGEPALDVVDVGPAWSPAVAQLKR